MFQSFSKNLLQAVAFAQEEASSLGSQVVSPEHLLLGIVRLSDDRAAAILRKRGVTLPVVLRAMSSKEMPVTERELPFSDASKDALKAAYERSQGERKAECAVEHVLPSLIQDRDVQGILKKLDISISNVQEELTILSETGNSTFEKEALAEKIAVWQNRALMAQQQGNSDLMAEALEKKKQYELLLKELGT